MVDYASLKVPELKKVLSERGLPTTGNKADLIARLTADDQRTKEKSAPAAEDEIDYSDDEPAVASEKAPEPAAPATAPTAAPASEAASEAAADAAAAPPAATDAATEEPTNATNPASLPSTDTAEEARKRAERAKRFGIDDEEVLKRTERATRFGVEESHITKMLDEALPERQSRKRGRENGNGGANKRQSMDRRGHNDRRNRYGGQRNHNNNRGGNRQGGNGGGQSKRPGVLDDPSERAKAEARAKRFSSTA
ncbi:hypothetical protein CFIMG_007785RA00001 [Ceratocystis fimbriata CBS 114723]|uniref:SAP domain-containing protein n=1 Tax=Ceratocystis fimbriata CBS 114723 TaxID=1035309 RepID=A0A2C5X4M5_9PEZI|nr:hypothetical protein CFIMG_007785RA00001 [Ceratocystis fimbriata CBS 114723]